GGGGEEAERVWGGAVEGGGGGGAVPVGREGRRGAADVERLAVAALERHAGRELAVGLPAEEVDLARPGAGKDVGPPVAVQVHQLWSEADASADRDAGDLAAGLEPGVRVEARLLAGAGVAVDAQPAVVVLAHEQAQAAVLIEVADERRRVALALHVECLTAGLDLHRRQQFARPAREGG